MRYASSLVFKRYKQEVASSLHVALLDAMPAYLESLPFSEGLELLDLAAWPCRLVDERGSVVGFVMPAIPDVFFVEMRKASGISREVAEFQHLLNDEGFLARRQIALSDRRRYELLRAAAQALSVLHRHGIAVGDLSPKNLLFSYEPQPRVYFIDCDAMRFQGRSVMPQVETPGWEVRASHPTEELGTAASDYFKLGLLALRLLVGSQDARDPDRLPLHVPGEVRALIAAALSADPSERPKAADWDSPLKAAAATASMQPTPSPPQTGLRPATLPVQRVAANSGVSALPTSSASHLQQPVTRPIAAPPQFPGHSPRPVAQAASSAASGSAWPRRIFWLAMTAAGLVIPFTLLYNLYPAAFDESYEPGLHFLWSILYAFWNLFVITYGLYRALRRSR